MQFVNRHITPCRSIITHIGFPVCGCIISLKNGGITAWREYSTLPIHTQRPKSHIRMMQIGSAAHRIDCCICVSLVCTYKDVYLPGCEDTDGILNNFTLVSLQMNAFLC